MPIAPRTSMRLHTRMIIRDGRQAFVGSQSLRQPELYLRREIGIIVRDSKVVNALLAYFEKDWVSTGFDEVRDAVKADAAAAQPETTAEATRALAKEMPPLKTTVKKAIKHPRANRFVESLFTAPVERRDWLIAKVLVLLTLAAAYYVALVPMLLVYTHHVGRPFLLGRFLVWTPGS
jgi:hypothetical protein